MLAERGESLRLRRLGKPFSKLRIQMPRPKVVPSGQSETSHQLPTSRVQVLVFRGWEPIYGDLPKVRLLFEGSSS